MIAINKDGYDARHVFISHASSDAEEAMRLCIAIEALNTNTWIAPRDIPPGKNYPAAIEAAIRASACVIVFITKQSNESTEVLKEVELSLLHKKPVVALLVKHGDKPTGGLAYHLASSQWLSQREDEKLTANEVIRYVQSVAPEAVGRLVWDFTSIAISSSSDGVFPYLGDLPPPPKEILLDFSKDSTAPVPVEERLRKEGRTPLPAGHMIAGSKIRELIGASDISLTYRAEKVGLRQDVVIRELMPRDLAFRRENDLGVRWETSSTVFRRTAFALRKGFARESRLSRLPQLVGFHLAQELYRERGTLYTVRAFVQGATLLEVVRLHRGRVSAVEGLDLFKLLLQELGRLHDAGVLHGDIKPQNILISDNSGPKLIDFDGLLEIGKAREKYLPVMVSQGFAAPELYACDPARATIPFEASLDLYELAATVYFCMTKERPIASEVDGKIEALIRDEFVPWRFASALGWCLATNPKMRPRSAADILALIVPS